MVGVEDFLTDVIVKSNNFTLLELQVSKSKQLDKFQWQMDYLLLKLNKMCQDKRVLYSINKNNLNYYFLRK